MQGLFYYYKDKWILPEHNSLNCVAVIEKEDIVIKELRALKKGELVVTGRSRDGSEGIFVYKEGFSESVFYTPGKAAETSFSEYYNFLFEQLKYERDNGGYIVWILGPSVVFDYDTRVSLNKLTEEGKSIIMISSEMSEILRMSDRIVIMCEGKKTGEIGIEEASQELIMNMATREIG